MSEPTALSAPLPVPPVPAPPAALLLLQFEQGRIDVEFVGTAMEDDISNGDASRVLTEVAKDALSITLLIVFVHIWLFKYYFSVNKAM